MDSLIKQLRIWISVDEALAAELHRGDHDLSEDEDRLVRSIMGWGKSKSFYTEVDEVRANDVLAKLLGVGTLAKPATDDPVETTYLHFQNRMLLYTRGIGVFKIRESLAGEVAAFLRDHAHGTLHLSAFVDLANKRMMLSREVGINHIDMRGMLPDRIGTSIARYAIAKLYLNRDGFEFSLLRQYQHSQMNSPIGAEWPDYDEPILNAFESHARSILYDTRQIKVIAGFEPRPSDSRLIVHDLHKKRTVAESGTSESYRTKQSVHLILNDPKGFHTRVTGFIIGLVTTRLPGNATMAGMRNYPDTKLYLSCEGYERLDVERSFMKLMTIDIEAGSRVVFEAEGPHATEVLDEISRFGLKAPVFLPIPGSKKGGPDDDGGSTPSNGGFNSSGSTEGSPSDECIASAAEYLGASISLHDDLSACTTAAFATVACAMSTIA